MVDLGPCSLDKVLHGTSEQPPFVQKIATYEVLKHAQLVVALSLVFSTSIQDLLVHHFEMGLSAVQLFFFCHCYGHQARGSLVPPFSVTEFSYLAIIRGGVGIQNPLIGYEESMVIYQGNFPRLEILLVLFLECLPSLLLLFVPHGFEEQRDHSCEPFRGDPVVQLWPHEGEQGLTFLQ